MTKKKQVLGIPGKASAQYVFAVHCWIAVTAEGKVVKVPGQNRAQCYRTMEEAIEAAKNYEE